MKIVFERIYERDIDLLLIRLFAENHPACGLFCRKAGIEGYSIKEIRHSAKSLHGESDVEVWMEADNQRYVLMFENKINAPAQPKQCARYSDRGNAYIRNGKADRFSVFIVAPADYLAANGEAQKYDKFQVSFEELKEQMYPDYDTFMIAILDRGIEKYRNAIIIDQQVTAFWQAYIAFQEKYAPELDLCKNISERGATSSWISFGTALSGISI